MSEVHKLNMVHIFTMTVAEELPGVEVEYVGDQPGTMAIWLRGFRWVFCCSVKPTWELDGDYTGLPEMWVGGGEAVRLGRDCAEMYSRRI